MTHMAAGLLDALGIGAALDHRGRAGRRVLAERAMVRTGAGHVSWYQETSDES